MKTWSLEQLEKELQQVSKQIKSLKSLIDAEKSPDKLKDLQRELKRLQYQALFYIEKITNFNEQQLLHIIQIFVKNFKKYYILTFNRHTSAPFPL